MREGNNILGVYACDPTAAPVAIRYLVDPLSPGAEITISSDGKKYTVCKLFHIYLLLLLDQPPSKNGVMMVRIAQKARKARKD